jgi:hypothetical protein
MSTGAKAAEADFLGGCDNLGCTIRSRNITILVHRDVSGFMWNSTRAKFLYNYILFDRKKNSAFHFFKKYFRLFV